MGTKNHDGRQGHRVARWFDMSGDTTLRLDYPLNSQSVVFDVGGYRGDWAASIFKRYGCTIHVFEPVKKFAEQLRDRFKDFEKIHVHAFGLAGEDRKIQLEVADDATSIYKFSGTKDAEEADLVRASGFLNREQINKIDLIKINIEGGEYELLENLLGTEKIMDIANLQIQFHDFIEGAPSRMAKIRRRLKETHYPTYQFEYVWDGWKRKSEPQNTDDSKQYITELLNQIDKDDERITAAQRDETELRAANKDIESKLQRLQEKIYSREHHMSYALGHLIIGPIAWLNRKWRGNNK